MAVWADKAWGRYWGWDPKEVWALVSLLIYLFLVHGRHAGWTGNFGLAVGMVIEATADPDDLVRHQHRNARLRHRVRGRSVGCAWRWRSTGSSPCSCCFATGSRRGFSCNAPLPIDCGASQLAAQLPRLNGRTARCPLG